MSKYHIFGAFLTLAAWSANYVPATTHQSASLQFGAAAQAGVRWTPNPDRGSASSTLSGGRRGIASSACAFDADVADPAITLLVPDAAKGLTTQAQPTLSWYLESDDAAEMEFVLSHPEQATPIYRQKINAEAGLVEVALPASAALEVGTRYRWTVFLTCKDGQQKVHARSFVERVEDSALLEAMGAMAAMDKADAFAAKGIWYDALNTLVGAYRADGELSTLLEIRELLDQANTEVPLELSLATAAAS